MAVTVQVGAVPDRGTLRAEVQPGLVPLESHQAGVGIDDHAAHGIDRTACHPIAAGDSLLSPSITRRVIDRMAMQPTPDVADQPKLAGQPSADPGVHQVRSSPTDHDRHRQFGQSATTSLAR
ncbi:MAG: hypothetical protein WKF58_02840 [Ilumatobacteraceae bacterium]